MAIFGLGKNKGDPATAVQVLAYLEDALRVRSGFTVEGGHGLVTSAFMHSVNEAARSFRLLPKADLPLAKGAKVTFTLVHEGLRIGGGAKVLEARAGVLALELPEALAVMERRRVPRARLNPKEGATLTALQDLFAGVGIFSALENVSEGGARVRVEKALAIGTEKRMVLGVNLVTPGQAFATLRLNKVPRCPPLMELAGKVVYLEPDAGGLVLGWAFGQLPGPVAQRCPPIPEALPVKQRRVAAPAEEAMDPAAEAPAPVVEAAAPGPAAAPDVPAAVPDVPEAAGQARAGSAPADPAERRSTPRLSLGAGFQAMFMVEDELVTEAELTDLSAGGCCLRLPLEQCGSVSKGVELLEFHFVHGDLPPGVLQGRVKWVLGRTEGGAGLGQRYCLVGVEFTQVTAAVREAISGYVASRVGQG